MEIFQIQSKMPGPDRDPVSLTPSSMTPDNFIHQDIVNIKSLLFALKSIRLMSVRKKRITPKRTINLKNNYFAHFLHRYATAKKSTSK